MQDKYLSIDCFNMMCIRFSYIFSCCVCFLATACGGGGPTGTADDGVASKTVTLFASGLNGPKHMVFKDGNLYVANSGTNSIKNAQTGANYFSLNGFVPFGMSLYGDDLFFTGTGSSAGVYKNQTNIVSRDNYYGIGFANGKLYVADNTYSQVALYDIGNFNIVLETRAVPEGFLQGIGVSGSDVFVTVSTPGKVIKISGPTNEEMTWGNFSLPNAIVFDGTYAYIANKGDVNGDGGYISRKKMSDSSAAEVFIDGTTGTWKTANTGFCGLAGLAISGSYLYASNGTCHSVTSSTNANTVLKIKL
jgi:hypothetical protein